MNHPFKVAFLFSQEIHSVLLTQWYLFVQSLIRKRQTYKPKKPAIKTWILAKERYAPVH